VRVENLALLPVGIAFVVLGQWVRRQTQVEKDKWVRSLTWPSCKGEVTRSEVVSEQDRPGGVFSSEARIEYAYSVNDIGYEADTPVLGATIESGDAAASALCSRHPLGAVVDVHYDPMDPATSFVERSERDPAFMEWIALGVTAAGGVMAVLGVLAIL
jgi:hypothetical protein